MTGKKKTLEDYLLEKISESGYPLEIEISSLLDDDYVVFNTSYYFDEQLKQGRDIDIYAIPYINSRRYLDDETDEKYEPFYINTEMTIECKKSDTHAWIFYTRPLMPAVSLLYMNGQYYDDYSETETGSNIESKLFDLIKLHYDDFKYAAVSYDEIKIGGKQHARREIFEGINQLIKHIWYLMGTPVEPQMFEEMFNITIMFPVIVFDGKMFEVQIKSDKPILKETKHVLIQTDYRSPYTEKVKNFLIDVVHRSYFKEFINIINNDFNEIHEIFLTNHSEFLKEYNETMKVYARAREPPRV